MAMSMLSDIVIMGGDRTGSFALAETKQGLFISSLQAIINSIAYALNTHAVPKLFAVNGWTVEKLPKIVADDLKAPGIRELLLRSLIIKNKDFLIYLGSSRPQRWTKRRLMRLCRSRKPLRGLLHQMALSASSFKTRLITMQNSQTFHILKEA